MKKIIGSLIIVIAGFAGQNLFAHEADDPDSKVRKKVIEGLLLAEAAKTIVEEAFRSGGLQGLDLAAYDWNNQFAGSDGTKYVKHIDIEGSASRVPGTIRIEYDVSEIPQLVTSNLMVLTPGIRNSNASTSLNDDVSGNIEWACAGSGSLTAMSRQLLFTHGTVFPRYSPEECR